MKTSILVLTCALASFFFVSSTHASDSYAQGDILADILVQDQFEQDYPITESTQILLFSRSMKGGNIIQDAFEEKPALSLNSAVVYLADISKMPSLISRFVAMPKFKAFPYRVALDREGAATAMLPAVKDQVTLIKLENLKILSIAQLDSVKSLLEATEAATQ